jgi:hypothetical protein
MDVFVEENLESWAEVEDIVGASLSDRELSYLDSIAWQIRMRHNSTFSFLGIGGAITNYEKNIKRAHQIACMYEDPVSALRLIDKAFEVYPETLGQTDHLKNILERHVKFGVDFDKKFVDHYLLEHQIYEEFSGDRAPNSWPSTSAADKRKGRLLPDENPWYEMRARNHEEMREY